MLCKFFFTFCGLSFHFVGGFFFWLCRRFLVWCSPTWVFDFVAGTLFIYLFIVAGTLDGISKKSLPTTGKEHYFCVFWEFHGCRSYIQVFNQFCLYFCEWDRIWVQLDCLTWGIQLFQHIYWRNSLFSIEFSCQILVDCVCLSLFLGSEIWSTVFCLFVVFCLFFSCLNASTILFWCL